MFYPEGPGALHPQTARLLNTIERRFNEFCASYRGLTPEQLLLPGVTGEWSVRDLIAHVTWWEEEALKHVPTVLAGGRPERYSTAYGGIDAFNALMTRQRAHLPLEHVLAQQTTVHRKLIGIVADIPLAELGGNSRIRRRIRLDTYGHYPLHTKQIIAWREASGFSVAQAAQPELFPKST